MIGGSCKMPMVRKRLQREFDESRERIQREVRDPTYAHYDPNYVVNPIKLLFFGKDPSAQQKDESVIFLGNEDAQLMVVKGSAVLGGAMAFSLDVTAADLEEEQHQGAEPSITDVLPMNVYVD